jgi:hypothetical protein
MQYTKPTTNNNLRRQYLYHGGYIPGQLRLPLSMVCGLQLLRSSLCTALPDPHYSYMLKP